MIVHLVAHALGGARPLSSVEACWKLWRWLRSAIPRVVAASLMPNHLHTIAVTLDADALRRRVAKALAAFARASGAGPMWERVPHPKIIADPGKLARDVRYVLLNACRGRLAADVPSWIWSTYRDMIGATVDPWVSVPEVAELLGYRLEGFMESFHHYVSGDPTISVAGTPLPAAAPPGALASLDIIAAAASSAAATAQGPLRRRTDLARQGYVLLAGHQGWRDAEEIGVRIGITPQSVRRLALKPNDPLLRAATLYAGDARLRTPARFRRE